MPEKDKKKIEELKRQYRQLQKQINTGKSDDEFLKKLKKAADDAVTNKVAIENTDYVPQDIKSKPGSNYCIGGVCYILNQAGEPIKYFDNSALQDDSKLKKTGRYLENSESGISPSDIIQFKRGDEKGGPYHAALVLDVSNKKDSKGFREIKVVSNSGVGPMNYKSYYLGQDNKIYFSPNNPQYAPTQLLKRENSENHKFNDLVRQRDLIKKQLNELEPSFLNPQEEVRYTNQKPLDIFFNNSAFYGGDPTKVDLDVPDKRNTYTLGMGADNRPKEQIYIENSRLEEMMTKYSDPTYKSQFMKEKNITDQEYQALVSNMFGIYGAESKFNTDYWGKSIPEPQFISKVLGIGTVGPFQLGRNNFSKELKKKYTNEDLHDPMKASEATMEYLAENLTVLRKRANDVPADPTYTKNITPDNYLEYLPYVHAAPSWLRGDNYTKKRYNDITTGTHPYKQNVDFYKNKFQLISSDFPEVKVEAPRVFKDGGCIDCNNDNTMKKIYKYGNGGRVAPRTPSAREKEVTPIYTSDPNDPRLKAYNDSLSLYNLSMDNRVKVPLGSSSTNDPFLKKTNNNEWEAMLLRKRLVEQGLKRNPEVNKIRESLGYNNSEPEYSAKIGFDTFHVFKKPVQPVVYRKPETGNTNIMGDAVLGSGNDFRHQPGGIFYDPEPSTPKHPTTPYIKKMPMRGMPNTDVSAEPIGTTPKSTKGMLLPLYLDSRGEWVDAPQTGQNYSPEQLRKMGYRFNDGVKNKATINKYGGGGIVPTQRDNTDTKYTPKLKSSEQGKYLRDPSGDYVGSVLLGLSPLDTPVDIYSTINDLKSGRYDRAALSAAGAMLPKVSSLTLKTLYDDFGNWVASKQSGTKKYDFGGLVDYSTTRDARSNSLAQVGLQAKKSREGNSWLGKASMTALEVGLPIAATALGGPLGGVAYGAVRGALGDSIPESFQNGGQVMKEVINIEGGGKQKGSLSEMKSRGELNVDLLGNILQNYTSYNPHPTNGRDVSSDVAVDGNTAIIPKKKAADFLSSNKRERQREILSLISKQKARERKKGVPMAADGWVTADNSNWSTMDTSTGKMSTPGGGTDWGSLATKYGPQALSLLSPLTKVGRGLFDKVENINSSDYMVSPNLKPSLISDTASQMMINDSTNAGLNSLRRMNAGPAATVNLAVNSMKQKWASRQEIQRANATSTMSTDQANKQIAANNAGMGLKIRDMNDMNKAAKRNMLMEGVNDLSKQGNKMIYDESFFQTLPMMADNPQFNRWLEKNGYRKG